MRNAFIDELICLAGIHSNIALVVGDLGFAVVEPFADRFPDRFINAGVAEQNMTGLAAGMASEGYHVFTYSIANFPVFRCAEQIRNDVDYHQLAVTVVAVGGGLSYGALGYSHHAIQDYALMRVMPNLLIAAPGDPMEVRACLRYLVANPQPSYLRLGKAGEPSFHQAVPAVAPGKWLLTRGVPSSQSRKVLLTTGAVLSSAMEWVAEPSLGNVEVCSLPLWSMQSKSAQVEQTAGVSHLVTVEDHLADGGFGSWMAETLNGRGHQEPSHRIVGLHSRVCGLVGTQSTLNKEGGLTLARVRSAFLLSE
jgi:transketolase